MEKWQTPSSYFGFDPTDDYLVICTHRGADCLTRSNWEAACQLLADASGAPVRFYSSDTSARPVCYVWRAGCSLFGWHEYLMIRGDAPQALIDAGNDITDRLADYPILDEDAFSELEWLEACTYWEECSVRERAALIRDSGSDASIFAARRSAMPSDNGAVQQWINAA